MKKKILVIGGAGYVGSALVPYLISKNCEVFVFDLFLYGKVFKEQKNLHLIKGDIRDIKFLNEIISKVDIIIHLACISNDPSFELNPDLGKSINFDCFEPLVEISKKNKINRFIYASSSSVYGVKLEPNITEEIELNPLTDYSFYKAECERVLLNYMDNNFIGTIVRPATVCGYAPRQRLDVVVNLLTNLAYNKREMTVFGGNQLRPNIHILDMIKVYYEIIKSPEQIISKQIFNAGIENKTVDEIANSVKKYVGNDVKINKKPTDDNRSYHIDSSKIKQILNFVFEYSVDDAIKHLLHAFDKDLLLNSLTDEKYFNIKKMQKVNLK